MTTPQIDSDYEVKLPIFEGPLDLLLYLVQKNELDPRNIAISAITDQYLVWMDTIEHLDLGNAGEFLVMAARLMRLKARELLPQDEKSELEEMEYELDRQELIAQMLEYQKFKEAARALRGFEATHFGAFPRGKVEGPGDNIGFDAEEECGIFDLLSAFRSVMLQKPRIPVHEVEIDDVTIEDRMQEIEIHLLARGRCLFEDFFENDPRRIAKVVTFMAILELCKTDTIVFRQSHGLGVIRVYRKQDNPAYDMELALAEEDRLGPMPETRPGLVDIVRQQIATRTVRSALDEAIREIEAEMNAEAAGGNGDVSDAETLATAKAMAEASETTDPTEPVSGWDNETDD
jgi:chromatin segregation and condensation protein Rec8/ScpA/Scc1 (kleisin family)